MLFDNANHATSQFGRWPSLGGRMEHTQADPGAVAHPHPPQSSLSLLPVWDHWSLLSPQTHLFQRAGFTEISFLSSWSLAFALFLVIFLPKLALCRVNCRKAMLKEKGMGFFFCFCKYYFMDLHFHYYSLHWAIVSAQAKCAGIPSAPETRKSQLEANWCNSSNANLSSQRHTSFDFAFCNNDSF